MPDYSGESCRACTSFKSFMRAQASFKKSKDDKTGQQNIQSNNQENKDSNGQLISHIDCPVDKDELGRASWTFLHTMAAYYPDKPTTVEKAEMKQFIDLFSKFYPCGHCAKDMRQDISVDPPKVDSREIFSQWMCNLHNKVNRKLGKSIFDCSKIDERWLNGPPDGKCD